MKKELIELAKKEGFESNVHIYPRCFNAHIGLFDVDKLNNFHDTKYYLWLCELQKWLIYEYKLHIYIVPIGSYKGWHLANIRHLTLDLLADKIDIGAKKESFKSYEQALEKGCFEALKIIK